MSDTPTPMDYKRQVTSMIEDSHISKMDMIRKGIGNNGISRSEFIRVAIIEHIESKSKGE